MWKWLNTFNKHVLPICAHNLRRNFVCLISWSMLLFSITLFSPHLVPSLTMPGSGTSEPRRKSHTPAGSASDGGLDDWRLDAKYDWGLNVLALQLPAHGVPERMRVCVFLWGLGKNFMVIELECSASCCAVPALTLLESAGMVATVSKAIAFRVDILKTQLRSSFSLYTHTKKDIYRISINFLFSLFVIKEKLNKTFFLNAG